jgi:hypothetical protein
VWPFKGHDLGMTHVGHLVDLEVLERWVERHGSVVCGAGGGGLCLSLLVCVWIGCDA